MTSPELPHPDERIPNEKELGLYGVADWAELVLDRYGEDRTRDNGKGIRSEACWAPESTRQDYELERQDIYPSRKAAPVTNYLLRVYSLNRSAFTGYRWNKATQRVDICDMKWNPIDQHVPPQTRQAMMISHLRTADIDLEAAPLVAPRWVNQSLESIKDRNFNLRKRVARKLSKILPWGTSSDKNMDGPADYI